MGLQLPPPLVQVNAAAAITALIAHTETKYSKHVSAVQVRSPAPLVAHSHAVRDDFTHADASWVWFAD